MSKKVANCGHCGKTITFTKMNRHRKKCNDSLIGIGWNKPVKTFYTPNPIITFSYKEK